MPTSLRTLLADERFHLRLLAGAGLPQLDAPISWVHSSDFPDPTPWLEEGQLLLTDGDQLRPGTSDQHIDAYVSRLRDRGILGLGFATGIIHDAVPAALVRACEALGIPLFEVADRTPFIAIIRAVADVIARDQRERLEWSLDAQRSIALAALRPDGLEAILAELERRLGCWVVLFDGLGDPVRSSPERSMPAALHEQVQDAVGQVLANGSRAGVRLGAGDGSVILQTLGRGGSLRGVLALGTLAPLDGAGADLVTSVIALASIALEQSRALEGARRDLRSGLFELLLEGNVDVAQRTAKRLWGDLPAEPLTVTIAAAGDVPDSLLTELELVAERRRGAFFFAERDDEVVVVSRADGLPSQLERHSIRAGTSAPVGWTDLARGLVEARRALAVATDERPRVAFDDLAGGGVLGLLARAGGEDVAARVLEPLAASGRPDVAVLLTSAATWLHANGAWDPAAKALGVHRHTLRARLVVVQQLIGLDLDRFADRAELWAALALAEVAPAQAAGPVRSG
jgi:purine catabolism regulator